MRSEEYIQYQFEPGMGVYSENPRMYRFMSRVDTERTAISDVETGQGFVISKNDYNNAVKYVEGMGKKEIFIPIEKQPTHYIYKADGLVYSPATGKYGPNIPSPLRAETTDIVLGTMEIRECMVLTRKVA